MLMGSFFVVCKVYVTVLWAFCMGVVLFAGGEVIIVITVEEAFEPGSNMEVKVGGWFCFSSLTNSIFDTALFLVKVHK